MSCNGAIKAASFFEVAGSTTGRWESIATIADDSPHFDPGHWMSSLQHDIDCTDGAAVSNRLPAKSDHVHVNCQTISVQWLLPCAAVCHLLQRVVTGVRSMLGAAPEFIWHVAVQSKQRIIA